MGVNASCGVGGQLRTARRLDAIPDAIARTFTGRTLRVYEIDLDSDGRPDHVVEEGPAAPQTFRRCFVDADGKVRSCARAGGDGFAYYWFAQLDRDPMLELFAMQGDDDSSDYRIEKLDPRTWERRIIVKIDPVLLDSAARGEAYWGYPWDVTDLVLERRAGTPMLRAAPRGTADLYRESDVEPLNVTVFFIGTPTQGEPGQFAAAVKASRLMSLDEVVRLSKAPPPPRGASPTD